MNQDNCCYLLSIVPPRIAGFEFDEEPSSLGDYVTVSCVVSSGDFPIDIDWLFNDHPINDFAGVSTVKTGKRVNALTIESVHGKHAGNYTCVAKNRAAIVNHTAVLIVNGKKEFPKMVFIFLLKFLNYSIPFSLK